MYEYEEQLLKQGYLNIVGTDEVGRGPMAGPLVAAAVILPPNIIIEGLNDSKKLTSKKREELYIEIMEKAIEVQVTFIDVETVDRVNVYEASKIAMSQSIRKMKNKVDYILADAMNLNLGIPSLGIIKGDAKSLSIAAASVIAKVERDHYMIEMDEKYPEYGFKNHKGYVTKAHLQAINKYGITEIHRKSFAPVRECLYQQTKLNF
jgi:ribonuclease HII